ncbi:MAG: NUDIX hydrolase [Deltaproteobacteria bacterium]|uniref:NUDIX domain-containing protein n=1 Tax=Desulfosarcina sp. BuS5 TaxID=933262 RepID=UPI00054D9246|nr:NUDIX hydrolase [Desulfosarcina sp. BuS5]MCD6274119.1 NUDIX hydrolase [Deltaproteobacteria bacterium]WDN87534.1 ADP-ribose pyrophosphatase [Desulfosarcina sp. BuS5]
MSPKVNKITSVYKGKVFDLVNEEITLENGKSTKMDIIRHPGAAAIIPFLDKDTLILLKQYRHAIGEYIWEIPAGTLEQDEDPIECAYRELTEETGYAAGKMEQIGAITPVPGYSDERILIFAAYDLKQAEQNLDDNEVLEVYEVKFSDAIDMIYNGEITDGKTITGLLMSSRDKACLVSTALQ